MTRIALFNDTGQAPHVGCRGVTSGHDRMLGRLGVSVAYRSFLGEWADLADAETDTDQTQRRFFASPLPSILTGVDAVVVNGEGTIHHHGGLHLLAILRGAQAMGIPTYLVNAVIQESERDLETLRRLRDFTVRDAASSRYLRRLDVSHRIVLDSIFEAEFADEPAFDMQEKIAVTDCQMSRTADIGVALTSLLASLGDDGVYYPLKDSARADAWQHAVADLRTARLVVTARHHGVCLAAMAGVPFVALQSNTWKVEGLLEVLPGDLSICTDLGTLPQACERALRSADTFTKIKQFVNAKRPLDTFAALASHRVGTASTLS